MRRRAFMAGAAKMLLASGCIVAPIRKPVGRIHYPGPTPEPTETLVILLPGWGDRAKDFARNGLIDAMRAAEVDADVVAVEAHSGCCWRRLLGERLEEDVIVRARAEGYQAVWVAGISMGAQGALLVAERCKAVDGVVLLSPWLGMHPVTRHIEAAGGLDAWRPPNNDHDPMTRVWAWIRATLHDPSCPLYLACGTRERWRSLAILADALPREHVVVAPGGHDWSTWRRAWPSLLHRGAFR